MAMFKKLGTKAHRKSFKKAEKQKKKGMKRQKLSTAKAKKRRKRKLIIGAAAVLIIAAAVYVVKDNHSVKVTTYYASHKDVPKEFEGYRILQISDIKGASFGEGQKRLINKINNCKFDMILLTGDYLESYDSDDYYIFVELLEAVGKDKPVLYILGNDDVDDPEKYDKDNLCFKDPDNLIGKALEEAGAKPVYPIAGVEKDGASIYFTGISYNEKIFDSLNFDSDKCFSVCVTHSPIKYNVSKRLASVNVLSQKEVDFDMEISGHTMGGVVRLPVFGAVYTKDGGLFPEEQYVYGMHNIDDGRISVISSGLGRDRGIRLFNTPEITIIELHGTQENDK